MKLKLTAQSLQYWQDNPIIEYRASLRLSMLTMNSIKVYPMSLWLQWFTWPNHRPWLMTILEEDYALGI